MLQNEVSLIPVSCNIFTLRRVEREKESCASTHHNYCHRWFRWDLEEPRVLRTMYNYKGSSYRLERCVLEQPRLACNTSRRACKVGRLVWSGENNQIFTNVEVRYNSLQSLRARLLLTQQGGSPDWEVRLEDGNAEGKHWEISTSGWVMSHPDSPSYAQSHPALLLSGLSTKYKLLPQYLKSAGYLTHAVGKEGRNKKHSPFGSAYNVLFLSNPPYIQSSHWE